MASAFYMDAHIPRAITLGLRMRKIDVLTAQEDRADTLPDPNRNRGRTLKYELIFEEAYEMGSGQANYLILQEMVSKIEPISPQ